MLAHDAHAASPQGRLVVSGQPFRTVLPCQNCSDGLWNVVLTSLACIFDMQVAKGHVTPSMQLSQMPVVQMLEKNLLLELGDDMKLLPQYLAAAEQLQLRRLRQGLLMKAGTPEGWRQLQSTGQLSRHGYMIA